MAQEILPENQPLFSASGLGRQPVPGGLLLGDLDPRRGRCSSSRPRPGG